MNYLNHKNPFLCLIGLFTIYLVLSGNQILTFKSKKKEDKKKYIENLEKDVGAAKGEKSIQIKSFKELAKFL